MSKRPYSRNQPMGRRAFLEGLLDRFWSFVDRGEPDDCWLWTGPYSGPNPCGMRYGNFSIAIEDSKTYSYRAHRMAWMLTNGTIPKGHVIMHSCDTPGCCNPAHLSSGTQRENVDDQIAKGRRPWGETHGRCYRLTADDVYEIRDSDEHPAIAAKRYGVHPTHIIKIRQRKVWTKLPEIREGELSGEQK